ncbi:histone-lysine N-methyltransferase SETMAR [Trichonephila clavipes]|nr:histone-lysine N-methyltransferase SETMAR [Trichonephila clavipes]
MLVLKVDVSYGTVWTIVHDRLRFRKVCAACVLKQLTDQQKELRIGLALQHLFWYQEHPAFMKRIVTEGVVLLHDNAPPHVSRVTQMELDKFKWETLDHPPYSLDMLPCNFHVFGPLKKHLKGKRFNSDDILKDTVRKSNLFSCSLSI